MNKIISLISMEVTLVSVFNNSVGPDGYMRLLMNSFLDIFTLIQDLCHMRSATVALIMRPTHQNKPQRPF